MAKKTSQPKDARPELRFMAMIAISEQIGAVLRTLLTVLGFVAIFYIIYLTAKVLAGTNTNAHFVVELMTTIGLNIKLAWAFGVSGIVYGLIERNLRRSKTKTLQGRIQSLEKRIDPNRTTSGLTEKGDTNPGDK